MNVIYHFLLHLPEEVGESGGIGMEQAGMRCVIWARGSVWRLCQQMEYELNFRREAKMQV